MRRRLAAAAIFLLAVAAASGAERRLRAAAIDKPAGWNILYLPSGKYLRALAMGYDEILADAVYLWSIQFYSEYGPENRYQYLDHIFDKVITELDPHYEDAYLIGALIMVAEVHDVERALRLLDKGIEANPADWILPFEAGFYCYDTLKDYRRAAAYFSRARAVPGAHPVVFRMHAEMFNRAGDKRSSLLLWMEIHQGATSDYERETAWRHVHDLRIQLDIEELEAAIEDYAAARGRRPATLHALVAAGMIRKVPKDPSDKPYRYDAATGKVTSSTPFMMRWQGW